MSNKEDLTHIRRQVDMYFDRILDHHESQQLLDRVNSDPAYHRVFNQEKQMRDAIRQSVQRSSVSPDLIQSIKNSIRMA